MDDILQEKLLYRILQGRLRMRLGDLVLFIYEPSSEIIEESFDIYDDAYQQAYFNNVPIKSELIEVLLNNKLWSPLDDKEADKLEDKIEDLKVDAYKKFFDKRKLMSLKMQITDASKKLVELRSKKLALDHTSCEGVASYSRTMWIMSKVTFYADMKPYDWKHLTVQDLTQRYTDAAIPHEQIREISRLPTWRNMWSAGKKQNNIFNRPVKDLTKDQLVLSSFSSMYDNIYESPESPDEKILEDDDATDGWIIDQQRKIKKDKKQRQIDEAIGGNQKIANSQEVFVMADNSEAANNIYELNDPHARNIIQQRDQQIKERGAMKFTELHDVKQDMRMQGAQQSIDQAKSRGRR